MHGRRQDPATDAWLPEATLDPATRAWLTGNDRAEQAPPAVPVQRPDQYAPRTAPTHVHGSGSGLGDWSAQDPRDAAAPAGATGAPQQSFAPDPAEPPLDPNAYPSEPEDPEVTRIAERSASGAEPASGAPEQPVPPVWNRPEEPAPQAAPAGPSWWVGRSSTTAASDASTAPDASDTSTPSSSASDASATSTTDAPAPGAVPRAGSDAASGAPAGFEPPQANDTAVVEPLVDRRPLRPAPLVPPSSQATTCHVCGHRLEPDDIFCAECGAVRPAVTAAFTGPIVPLPMDRPDWAADDSVPDDAVPEDSVPDDSVPDDSVPDDSVPDDFVPGDSVPDDSVSHRAPRVPDDLDVAAEDTPRVPIRQRGAHAAPEDDPDAGEHPAEVDLVDVPRAPGSATHPSSAPTAPEASDVRVPAAAPLPPVPGMTGPVLPLPTVDDAPTSADDDDDEDVDETRIVSKMPTQAPFVLHFSTGERFGVHGTGLVGRLPRPQPGERYDDLLTVHDPGKSVSKTHLELGRDGDDLWVSDRFSGNGTVVRHIDGSIRRCEPGRRYRVERGARVDIGEQFFLVQ
ncbi:FHA domain-containing protein [Curtobacterium sp. SP.BCo]|uniref:FHA domain-containing protein n=1 Tax=Curtobacterium sp. SP.BCo TaxID=3435229 RepID=UPI003F7362D6